MAILRGPEGCPWDQEQTHQSILPQLIEETYEFIDAVEKKNDPHIREELGDLLLHFVFHAQMAHDRKAFDVEEVINGLCEKLVRRHPHVFGDISVKNSGEVIENWDTIKANEKKNHDGTSLLDSVPQSLPALAQAFKLSKKVAKVGFDWNHPDDVLKKIEEEIGELREALKSKNQTEIENEMGDLLFSISNWCRFLKIDPETALRHTNSRFRNRFSDMEKNILATKTDMKKLSSTEWDQLWKQAKKNTK